MFDRLNASTMAARKTEPLRNTWDCARAGGRRQLTGLWEKQGQDDLMVNRRTAFYFFDGRRLQYALNSYS
jgi:hypothetical protein